MARSTAWARAALTRPACTFPEPDPANRSGRRRGPRQLDSPQASDTHVHPPRKFRLAAAHTRRPPAGPRAGPGLARRRHRSPRKGSPATVFPSHSSPAKAICQAAHGLARATAHQPACRSAGRWTQASGTGMSPNGQLAIAPLPGVDRHATPNLSAGRLFRRINAGHVPRRAPEMTQTHAICFPPRSSQPTYPNVLQIHGCNKCARHARHRRDRSLAAEPLHSH